MRNPHVQFAHFRFDEGAGETDRGYDAARSTPRKRVIATGAAKPELFCNRFKHLNEQRRGDTNGFFHFRVWIKDLHVARVEH